MEFTFLGTSAGEQYPAFWCKCEYCAAARQMGGRNIRSNSCAHLGPDCLIDLNHWTFEQGRKFGVPIMDARYLLVTHAHEDHLSPHVLGWRWMDPQISVPVAASEREQVMGPRFSELEMLHVYGSQNVQRVLLHGKELDTARSRMEFHTVAAGDSFNAGNMEVHALLGNHHDASESRSLNYIIERSGKTILYLLDTGWPFEESLDRIANFRYDLVVVEGTFGFGKNEPEHMNFTKVERLHNWFRERSLLISDAPFCVSHIGPHWAPPHDELEPLLAEKGLTTAWDGLKIDLC